MRKTFLALALVACATFAHAGIINRAGTTGAVTPPVPSILSGTELPGTCTSCTDSIPTAANWYYGNPWPPIKQPAQQGSPASPYYVSDVMTQWVNVQLDTVASTKSICLTGASPSGAVSNNPMDYGIAKVDFYLDGSDTTGPAAPVTSNIAQGDPQTYNIISTTGNGTTAVSTMAVPFAFSAPPDGLSNGYGIHVSISGAGGFNGSYQLTASDPATPTSPNGTITYPSTFNGTVSGGTLTVTEPEYWCVQVDPAKLADGLHELRAVVWPKIGWPRLMEGPHYVSISGNNTSIDTANGTGLWQVPAHGFNIQRVSIDSVGLNKSCLTTTGTTVAQNYFTSRQTDVGIFNVQFPPEPLRGYQFALSNDSTGTQTFVNMNGCTDDQIVVNDFRGYLNLGTEQEWMPYGFQGGGAIQLGLQNNHSYWFFTNANGTVYNPTLNVDGNLGIDAAGCGSSGAPCKTINGAINFSPQLNANTSTNTNANNDCTLTFTNASASVSTPSTGVGACNFFVGQAIWASGFSAHGMHQGEPFYVESLTSQPTGTSVPAGTSFNIAAVPMGAPLVATSSGTYTTVHAAADGVTVILAGTSGSPQYYNAGDQPSTAFNANFSQWFTLQGQTQAGAILNSSGDATTNLGVNMSWAKYENLSICGINPAININPLCSPTEANPYSTFELAAGLGSASAQVNKSGLWMDNVYIVGSGTWNLDQCGGIVICTANTAWGNGAWITNSLIWQLSVGPVPMYDIAFSEVQNTLFSGNLGQFANTHLLLNATDNGLAQNSPVNLNCAAYFAAGNPGGICNSDGTITSQNVVPVTFINHFVETQANDWVTTTVNPAWGSGTYATIFGWNSATIWGFDAGGVNGATFTCQAGSGCVAQCPASGFCVQACYDAAGLAPNCPSGQTVFANCESVHISCIQFQDGGTSTTTFVASSSTSTGIWYISSGIHVDGHFIKDTSPDNGGGSGTDYVTNNYNVPNVPCDNTNWDVTCNVAQTTLTQAGIVSDWAMINTQLGAVSAGVAFLGPPPAWKPSEYLEGLYTKNSTLGSSSANQELGIRPLTGAFFGHVTYPQGGGPFGNGAVDPLIWDNSSCQPATTLNNAVSLYYGYDAISIQGNGTTATVMIDPTQSIPSGSTITVNSVTNPVYTNSAITWSGTTETITFTPAVTLPTGALITITGATPSNLDVTNAAVLSGATAGSLSVTNGALTGSGSASVAGSITLKGYGDTATTDFNVTGVTTTGTTTPGQVQFASSINLPLMTMNPSIGQTTRQTGIVQVLGGAGSPSDVNSFVNMSSQGANACTF